MILPEGCIQFKETLSRQGDSLPQQLIQILADAEIERQEQFMGTVFSAAACPAQERLWDTFGGYPSASRGLWGEISWPWKE